MDAKYIIKRGDTAKYKVTIHHADFDQARDEYAVVLYYGMMGGRMEIPKKDMPVDEDGNIYMLFNSTDMVGWIKAECHYYVPDSDLQSGVREEVDIQYIGFSTSEPNPKLYCEMPEQILEDGIEHVKYERVWRSDVNTLYLQARTSEGEVWRDSEGKVIRVRKEDKDIY